jgi:hypothetical protein
MAEGIDAVPAGWTSTFALRERPRLLHAGD